MADLSKLPKDFYVTSMQFTKNAHRDAYPAIDPSLPEHSLAGKVARVPLEGLGLWYVYDDSSSRATVLRRSHNMAGPLTNVLHRPWFQPLPKLM